jgi:hypothetical protein
MLARKTACAMWRLVATAALSFGLAAPADADNRINAGNSFGDEYGNIVYYETGGSKIIFVGAAAAKSDVVGRRIRSEVPVYRRGGKQPAIITPPADPMVIGVIPPPNTSCDSPIMVKGLGYQYGIDRNSTIILGHPDC